MNGKDVICMLNSVRVIGRIVEEDITFGDAFLVGAVGIIAP